MENGIKAIETSYNGVVFKSRLEARWARFFDIFRIVWEYEPEGFTNGGYAMYLPDFYLPEVHLRGEQLVGVYIEIKPNSFELSQHPEYEHKFELMRGKNFVLCIGNPPPGYNGDDDAIQIYPFRDNAMTLMICSECGFIKFEYNEGNYMVCGRCNKNTNSHGAGSVSDIRDVCSYFKIPNDNRLFNSEWDKIYARLDLLKKISVRRCHSGGCESWGNQV